MAETVLALNGVPHEALLVDVVWKLLGGAGVLPGMPNGEEEEPFIVPPNEDWAGLDDIPKPPPKMSFEPMVFWLDVVLKELPNAAPAEVF